MLRLLRAVSDAYTRHLVRRADAVMLYLYPDAQDRASAHLSIAAELTEAAMFGDGETLAVIQVMPMDGGGYYIEALAESEIESDV